MIHVDGVIRLANQALASMLGLERSDELIGQPVWQFIAPQDREMAQAYAKARREGRPAPNNFELHLLKRDGSVILLDCMASSIAWEGGQATLATVVDMTERKRAEQGLRASEERFRQIAENIKEAFLVVELDGYRPLYLSRMWEEIWGRPLDEAYRNPLAWVQAIHPDDAAVVGETRQAIEKGEPISRNFRVVRPDGTIRWVRARAFPVNNANRELYRVVGLVEDITDVRRTEEQLLQAQKMEAVGRLAGGVAHDFNNLLTAILGYSELVLQDLGTEHPSSIDVREIRAAGQSAESLTRQLLAFSRRQILQPQTLDLEPGADPRGCAAAAHHRRRHRADDEAHRAARPRQRRSGADRAGRAQPRRQRPRRHAARRQADDRNRQRRPRRGLRVAARRAPAPAPT